MIQHSIALISLILLTAAGPLSAAEPQQTDIFSAGQGGYHAYRIPSVVVTTRGTVLAFCEGRKNGAGDAGKIDVLLKRSTDAGRTFSGQQVVWSDGDNTCGNPCAVVDRPSGAILLLLTHNLGRDKEPDIIARKSQASRTVWLTESRDDGQNWSPPREITRDVKAADWTWYATGPGAGIQLADGRLVIPCDHITAGTRQAFSHVITSDDHGAHWQLGGSAGPGTNECEVVQRADGSLLLNMRNHGSKVHARATAVSRDAGRTWSAVAHDAALVEPVCQASLRRWPAAGGQAAAMLFSNPADTQKREKLTVRLSRDEGQTWPASKLLWAGPAAYSCLAVLPDGTILCLYERGAKRRSEQITLARFSRQWLEE